MDQVEKGFSEKDGSHNEVRTEDIALNLIAQNAESASISEEEARAVLWKIDLYMLPLMFFVYALQYLDKVTYGLGSQFGAIADLQLSVVTNGVADLSRFKFGSSIFWIGFICGLYPLTYLAQRFPVSKACGTFCTIWGLVFLTAPLCSTWQGIWTQRFFLGFFEAGVSPCFMFLTANFYKKAEQASRSAFWFCATGGSIIIGYPMILGVVSIDMALAKWKAIYFLWGSFTVVAGIAFFFLVPDSPTTCWFLTERQRFIAVERLRENQADIECPTFKMSQVWEALTDPRVLLMFIIPLLNVLPNACVSTFAPIVLAGLGYTPKQVLVMSIPSGVTNFVVVAGMGYVQQRIRNFRSAAYTITLLPVIVCAALLWKLPTSNTAGRLASVIIFPIFTSSFVSALSLTTSNVAGATKRGVANAIFLAGYSTGQIIGPLTYPSTEAPLFQTGFKVTLVALIISMFLVYIYTYLGWRENKRRDSLGAIAIADNAFHDLTDRQNMSFRYEL